MASAESGFTAAQAEGLRAALRPNPVQVIAVTGGKGGVGKTCVAINLAAALAAQGKRVLMLDGDLGLANADVQLGIAPRYTLEHVLDGRCTLEEAIVETPAGFKLIPGASGVAKLAALSTAEHLGLVQAFSQLACGIDVLIIDTAAGISDSVRQFCQAAQHVLVVLRDEPASLADAYATVKVLHRAHGVGRFHVMANMSPSTGSGEALFRKLQRVADRFLDVVLEYAGEIPEDRLVRTAICAQRSVFAAYPSAPASRAFARLALRTAKWPVAAGPRGNIEFMMERLLPRPTPQLEPGMSAVGAYSAVAGARRAGDELVEQHAGLVKRIAYHLAGRLPASVEVDDLIQAGMIGLLEAAAHYSPDRGASFETYAGIRIRGAMIDALRQLDWAPRSVHRKARDVAAAMRAIEVRQGRAAEDGEVAAAMGITLQDYHEIVQDAASCQLSSLDEVAGMDDIPGADLDPLLQAEGGALREAVAAAISALPERERLVMSLYYDEELNLKEIGAVLGVSESRTCQLHGQALIRLRGRLATWRRVT